MTDRSKFSIPEDEAGEEASNGSDHQIPDLHQQAPSDSPAAFSRIIFASLGGKGALETMTDIELGGDARGQIIDLRRYRLARVMRDAGRQQSKLARLMRESSAERSQLAEALQAAQGHLVRISDGYKSLLSRLQREKGFRTACQEAAELDDLDEMVRRRDALVRELEDIRTTNRQPVLRQPPGDSGIA